LSGTPLTVINTPYLQEIGTEPSWLQKTLMKRKWLKKYVKMFIVVKGMKSIEKSTFGASYKTIFVAGPTIEDVHEVKSVKEIVKGLVENL
jgi:nitronate monooxygenase